MHGLPFYGETQSGALALSKTTTRFTPRQELAYLANTSEVMQSAKRRFEDEIKKTKDLSNKDIEMHKDKI